MKKVMVIGAHSYIGKKFDEYVKGDKRIEVSMVSASNGQWKEESFQWYSSVILLSGVVHQRETLHKKGLYDKVNYHMAVSIARKAKDSGVKHFVYMSTLAVFGNQIVEIGKETKPNPTSFYGISKYRAEKEILSMETKQFQVAILRPPMVYGKGCPGNYKKLVKVAKYLLFVPALENRRSMIYVDNLNECLKCLILTEGSGIYHPQDKNYVSTRQLILTIRQVYGKKAYDSLWLKHVILFLKKRVGILNKIFGDLYYKKEDLQMGFSYQEVDFQESVRRSL